MMIITYDMARIKKIAVGGGVTAAIGTVFLEYYRLKRTLNHLINTECLDVDKKRPDYIYIKYSIYRESMAARRQQHQFDANWVNVFVQPLGKWWKTFKHSVAWRLLEVAKTGDHYDRLKAVHQLSRIVHLKDWDYQHLAQICDARTAVSLARHECDARWFVRPRALGAVRAPKSLIAEMRDLLDTLTPACRCVPHFRANVLGNFAILRGFEQNAEERGRLRPLSECKITQPEFVCLTQCLHVMFHVTRDPVQARRLIDAGLLQTLMEVHKLFHRNVEMQFLLAKVLANVALAAGDVLADVFCTGWIGVLAQMARNPDLRVQVTAAKALTNLDGDDHNGFAYTSRVYPLYPQFCSRQRPAVDVVFVHGLLGGVFVTWRQKDREEPQLGLYGKNAIFYTKTSDDDALTSVSVYNSRPERQKRLCPSHAVRPAPVMDGWRRAERAPTERATTTTTKPGENEVLMYNELPLVSRGPPRKSTSSPSDPATNELIQTLQSANEIGDDWEVVFADVPVDAKPESSGPYSVAGAGWRNDESPDEYTYCWPMDWLPVDYPTVRVLGVNYETALSEWYVSHHSNCPCEKAGTLHNRAEELLHSLAASGVGAGGRPVVWVGHSMGGLIAKSIIVQAADSPDPAVRQLAHNTQAIVFLGTPHLGSAVAKLKQHTQLILSPTVEVKELEENSAYLLRLHRKFEQYLAAHSELNRPMHIVSVAEGNPTRLTTFKFPFHIVQEQSARLRVGDHYVLNVDHLGLSKPIFRQSFLYQRILELVGEVLSAEQRKAEAAAASGEDDAVEDIADV